METLRNALECVFRAACVIDRTQDLPIRRWLRVRETPSGDVRLETERRVDVVMLAHRMFSAVEDSASMNAVIECIQNSEELRQKLLVDYSGKQQVPSQMVRDWIGSIVLVWPFMLAYLARLPEARFDRSVFDSVYEHVSEDIRLLPCRKVQRICPLLGIRMSTPEITLESDLKLRKVSPDELETWLNVDFPSDRPTSMFELRRSGCVIEESFVLDPPATQSQPPTLDRVYSVLNLLRLLNDAAVYIRFVEEKKHRVLFGPGSHLRSLPSLGDSSRVDDEATDTDDEKRLLSAWRRLNGSQASDFARKLSFALRRYGGSFDRVSDEDRLVDYWIALESLFAADGNQDTTYRVSLRLAAYVADDPRERVRVYTGAKTSYKFRSAIVHGAYDSVKKLSKKHDFRQVVSDTASWLRASVLRLLESDERLDASRIEERLLSGSADVTCPGTRDADLD